MRLHLDFLIEVAKSSLVNMHVFKQKQKNDTTYLASIEVACIGQNHIFTNDKLL